MNIRERVQHVTLSALKRYYPAVESLEWTYNYVVFYTFDEKRNAWESTTEEGAMHWVTCIETKNPSASADTRRLQGGDSGQTPGSANSSPASSPSKLKKGRKFDAFILMSRTNKGRIVNRVIVPSALDEFRRENVAVGSSGSGPVHEVLCYPYHTSQPVTCFWFSHPEDATKFVKRLKSILPNQPERQITLNSPHVSGQSGQMPMSLGSPTQASCLVQLALEESADGAAKGARVRKHRNPWLDVLGQDTKDDDDDSSDDIDAVGPSQSPSPAFAPMSTPSLRPVALTPSASVSMSVQDSMTFPVAPAVLEVRAGGIVLVPPCKIEAMFEGSSCSTFLSLDT